MLGYHREQNLDLYFFLVMINDLSATLPLYKYVGDVPVFEVVPLSSIEPPVLMEKGSVLLLRYSVRLYKSLVMCIFFFFFTGGTCL